MKRVICILLILLLMPIFGMSIQAEGAVTETSARSDVESEPISEVPGKEPISFETLRAYAEETLIPIVTFVIAAIGTIYVAISPVLIKIKRAGERFKSATEDVNGARDESRKTTREMKALEEELRREIAAVKAHEAKSDRTMQRMEHMMRVGFGNLPELVKSGYAREIERIAAVEEDEDEQSEA